MASIEEIKRFWQETGVSLQEAKKALEEANGDAVKAKELLASWGKKLASKKDARETKAGIIESYVHTNKQSGVLVDVRCETDFVAKSPEFGKLAHELALHIAAMKPMFVSEAQIPEATLQALRMQFEQEAQESGKPAEIAAQMVEGKLKKYATENSLMSQPWVKDDSKTIVGLVEETVSKVGEKIEVKNFVHYEI